MCVICRHAVERKPVKNLFIYYISSKLEPIVLFKLLRYVNMLDCKVFYGQNIYSIYYLTKMISLSRLLTGMNG